MSSANKCDRCGEFYVEDFGDVTIVELHVCSAPANYQNWTDIQFCPSCSVIILDAIGPAIQDVKRPKPKRAKK